MIRLVAGLVDRVLNWLAPPIDMLDVLGPDDLADIEADLDCYEPDELWAAANCSAPPSQGSPRVGGTGIGRTPMEPAGADAAVGVGGFVPKSDEQVIEELVADYRDFVRECFKQRRG